MLVVIWMVAMVFFWWIFKHFPLYLIGFSSYSLMNFVNRLSSLTFRYWIFLSARYTNQQVNSFNRNEKLSFVQILLNYFHGENPEAINWSLKQLNLSPSMEKWRHSSDVFGIAPMLSSCMYGGAFVSMRWMPEKFASMINS